jgi:hypothetical protein
MTRILISVVAFISSLIVMVMVSTTAWDAFLNGKVYLCTDGGTLDFLCPGDWVHHPITVDRIGGARSMSDPDEIKRGWSMTRLWCVWFTFVGLSVIISAWIALAPWGSKERTGESTS